MALSVIRRIYHVLTDRKTIDCKVDETQAHHLSLALWLDTKSIVCISQKNFEPFEAKNPSPSGGPTVEVENHQCYGIDFVFWCSSAHKSVVIHQPSILRIMIPFGTRISFSWDGRKWRYVAFKQVSLTYISLNFNVVAYSDAIINLVIYKGFLHRSNTARSLYFLIALG